MRRKLLLSPDEEGVEEPLINLTPLIDVVFVLLISFMLIAPMLDVDLVDLAPSGAIPRKGASAATISIALRADNSIWFQGKSMNLAQLSQVMKIEKERQKGLIPQLVADKNAHFGMYQEIKNVLEGCGFEQMDVLLKP